MKCIWMALAGANAALTFAMMAADKHELARHHEIVALVFVTLVYLHDLRASR
jgi:hypothetical protein